MTIGEIIAQVYADPFARTYIFGLIILAGILYLQQTKNTQIANIAPGLLTSGGVLGTFLGILLGLLEFDVGNIDGSIPELLAGMKFAFSTSIVGLFMAIIWRIYFTMKSSQNEKEETEPTPREVLTVLEKIEVASTTLKEELISEFRAFAETMAQKSTDALIKALEEVIRDFNTKLNEQFGENFKRLKESMDKLVLWQDNYKEHIEQTEIRLSNTTHTLERAANALTVASEKTGKIPEQMAALQRILDALNSQTIEFESYLEAIAGLGRDASEAFPVIEQNLKNLTSEFGNAVNAATQNVKEAAEKQSETFAGIVESQEQVQQQTKAMIESLAEQTNRVVTQIGEKVNGIIETQEASFRMLQVGIERLSRDFEDIGENLNEKAAQVSEQLAEAAEQQLEHVRNTGNEIQEVVRDSIASANKGLEQVVNEFVGKIQGMSEAQSKNLDNFGQQLVSITDKLARQYGELAETVQNGTRSLTETTSNNFGPGMD